MNSIIRYPHHKNLIPPRKQNPSHSYSYENFDHYLQKVKYYNGIANEYREAIHAILWHEEDGTWYDYDKSHRRPRRIFYPSNLAPLYTQSYDPIVARYKGKRAVEYLKANRIPEFQGEYDRLCKPSRIDCHGG